VNNSVEFIDNLKQIELEEGDQVSFHVVNVFTSVPRSEAVQELRKRLEKDPKLLDRTTLDINKIMELFDLCLDSTHFQLGENFYEQRCGLVMGSPLSPILADICMEHIESKIKEEDTEGYIKIWKRYVDDIFTIIRKGGDPDTILNRANTMSSTIKFTLEREEGGVLPFLDVKVTKEGNKLTTTVYRKATDSGYYLHYASNHTRSLKVGVAACLLKRAETHCENKKEKK
jgi:hypothetical protein